MARLVRVSRKEERADTVCFRAGGRRNEIKGFVRVVFFLFSRVSSILFCVPKQEQETGEAFPGKQIGPSAKGLLFARPVDRRKTIPEETWPGFRRRHAVTAM